MLLHQNGEAVTDSQLPGEQDPARGEKDHSLTMLTENRKKIT
jgi:hypothetical protein